MVGEEADVAGEAGVGQFIIYSCGRDGFHSCCIGCLGMGGDGMDGLTTRGGKTYCA